MNMKRNIIYLAIAVIVAACAPEKEIEFALDTKEINIGPEGGVRTIRLEVGEPWTAMTNEPWVAVSPANGKGSEECRVIIDSTLLNDTVKSMSGYRLQAESLWSFQFFRRAFHTRSVLQSLLWK